jgi:hypothetical protein
MLKMSTMLKKMILMSMLVLVAAGINTFGQGIEPRNMEKFQIMEDSLVVTADSMYQAFLPDARLDYSERFARQLVRALKIPNSYLYRFDSLKKLINIQYADDNGFRIFNWCISPSQATKRYYGAIQLPQENLKLYGLRDYTEQLEKGAADSILTSGMWFGALYYRILSQEINGKKIYFLFGYNSGSPISNKKVLDPLMITERGVTFGAPVFNLASENFKNRGVNRFILEYKKDVQVSMNWDAEKAVIVFDNLVSQMNDPNRKYTFVPSGQYDGLRWDGGRWSYIRDLMPITILRDGEAPSEPVK